MTFHHRLHGLTQIISLRSCHRMKQNRFGIKKQEKRKQCASIDFCGESLYDGGFRMSFGYGEKLPGSYGKLLPGLQQLYVLLTAAIYLTYSGYISNLQQLYIQFSATICLTYR